MQLRMRPNGVENRVVRDLGGRVQRVFENCVRHGCRYNTKTALDITFI